MTSFTSTSVTLSWQPPASEETNGRIRGYTLRIIEHGSSGTRRVSSTRTELQSMTLHSLHPHYTYTFQLAAETIGIGPFATNVTIQLPEDSKFSLSIQRILNCACIYSALHSLNMQYTGS